MTNSEKEDKIETVEGIQIEIMVIDAGQIAMRLLSEVLVGDDAKMMQASINQVESMTVMTFFDADGDFIAIPKPLLDTSIIRVIFVDVVK